MCFITALFFSKWFGPVMMTGTHGLEHIPDNVRRGFRRLVAALGMSPDQANAMPCAAPTQIAPSRRT
jgi:hypothetical protein